MRWYRSERFREFAVSANDGIISTAGVLQGFAGAGAGSSTLLVASISAMVAGSVASFGAKYAELAAQRDNELAVIVDEQRDLADGDADEIASLTAHFEQRGLSGTLAREVAERMHAHDPLTAQLEIEHGITDPMRASRPLWGGLATAGAFASGSALPLIVLLAYPAAWEEWAVFVAVLVSLAATSVLIALSAGTPLLRALRRTIGIGLATMAISFVVGSLVF